MGQKVNPIGMRVTVTKEWQSKWYAEKNSEIGGLLHEDAKIRNIVKNRLRDAAVPGIHIERYANRARVTISTARPGIVIGKSGSEVDALRREIHALTHKNVHININVDDDVDVIAMLTSTSTLALTSASASPPPTDPL